MRWNYVRGHMGFVSHTHRVRRERGAEERERNTDGLHLFLLSHSWRTVSQFHTFLDSHQTLSKLGFILSFCAQVLSLLSIIFLTFVIVESLKNIHNFSGMCVWCMSLCISLLIICTVCMSVRMFTWLRVAEYSGLTGRKGTALRSVTRVLWFWVVSHTGGTNIGQKNKSECVSVCLSNNVILAGTQTDNHPVHPPTHT